MRQQCSTLCIELYTQQKQRLKKSVVPLRLYCLFLAMALNATPDKILKIECTKHVQERQVLPPLSLFMLSSCCSETKLCISGLNYFSITKYRTANATLRCVSSNTIFAIIIRNALKLIISYNIRAWLKYAFNRKHT